MVVVSFDVMQGADPANDPVGHRDYPRFQAPADLHIWLNPPKEEPDINIIIILYSNKRLDKIEIGKGMYERGHGIQG